MGVAALFNQTITLYPKASYNKDGREVVGAGVTHKVRIQPVTKSRLLPNGQVARIDAICYMKPDVTVEIDYKITHNGKDYKVFGKSLAIDGSGNTNHIKFELIQWKAT